MSYLQRRVALAPLLLVTVSFLTFWSLRLIGSNQEIVQGMLGTNYTDDNAIRLTKQLGLNRPFFSQYFHWLFNLLRGDLALRSTAASRSGRISRPVCRRRSNS